MKISLLLILQRNHTWRFSSFKNTLRCLMRYLDLACRLGNFSTILRASPYEITFFTVHYEAYFFLKHSILYGFKVVRNHYLRPPSLMGDAKFKQNIWVTGDFQLTLRETISKTVVMKPNYLNTNLSPRLVDNKTDADTNSEKHFGCLILSLKKHTAVFEVDSFTRRQFKALKVCWQIVRMVAK